MKALLGATVFAFAVGCAWPAAGHIALNYPPSRYGADVLKQGPCGVAGGTRSANVTELKSGARVEVVWDEYVNHPGHFRISFDVDGDDDFVDPMCLSGCDTRTPEIAAYSNASVLLDDIPDTPDGGLSRVTVTLPDVECERCTLQVIQVMYDKPPYEVPGNDIYYQCADLILRRDAPPRICPGDCNGDGQVSVDELITAIGIVLGTNAIDECRACDADSDGLVSIAELVTAVASALNNCSR